jgi:hypothetical protein
MESKIQREENNVPEIYSKAIRAGKRTYFFDVKSTRNNEYYLTITESKKKFGEDGSFRYEKHKLFLYPEDFEKFSETLEEVIGFIYENQPEKERAESEDEKKEVNVGPAFDGANFNGVEFEDM